MPIYEYSCQKCDHQLEALQKLSDDPLVFCPECGEPSLRKQVSAAAFRLKGTGWYETDFKNSDKKKKKSDSNSSANSSNSGEESGAGKVASKKSESSSESSTDSAKKSEANTRSKPPGSDST
tara:strand:- start:98 stop:463 length:366 start_codon:yes stop_codon:yes gene_type:complete